MSDAGRQCSASCTLSFALVSLCAILAFYSLPARSGQAEGCEQFNAREYRSHDGNWVARVYGKVCDLGIASSAAVLVDLFQPRAPEMRVTVLSIDMPSNRVDWPTLTWESPNMIAIALSGSANIALQMAKVQGIEIQVDYCSSGRGEGDQWIAYRVAYDKWVKAMEAWGRSKGQHSEASAPKPVAPVQPSASSIHSSCNR